MFFEEFDKDTKRSLTYRIGELIVDCAATPTRGMIHKMWGLPPYLSLDYVLVYKEDDSDGRGCFSSMMRCVRRRRKPQEIRMLRERFLERAEEMGLKIKEQPKEVRQTGIDVHVTGSRIIDRNKDGCDRK